MSLPVISEPPVCSTVLTSQDKSAGHENKGQSLESLKSSCTMLIILPCSLIIRAHDSEASHNAEL